MNNNVIVVNTTRTMAILIKLLSTFGVQLYITIALFNSGLISNSMAKQHRRQLSAENDILSRYPGQNDYISKYYNIISHF